MLQSKVVLQSSVILFLFEKMYIYVQLHIKCLIMNVVYFVLYVFWYFINF